MNPCQPPTRSTPVALALGGNLGDTAAVFAEALRGLSAGGLVVTRVSAWHRTRPVGCHPGTHDFLNGALIGEWSGTPAELLALTQALEQRAGRPAMHDSRASRVLDLDILLFGDAAIQTPRLIVPHPRMAERLFMLQPLAEIAPDWPVPGTDRTVQELCQSLLHP